MNISATLSPILSIISAPVVLGKIFSSARSARVHIHRTPSNKPVSPLPTLAEVRSRPFFFLCHMLYPSIEERRLDWINYPCLTEEFSEHNALTGVAARPASQAAQAERRLAMTPRSGPRLSLRRRKWLRTLSPCASQTLRQRRPRPRPQQRPPSHMALCRRRV